MRITKDRETRRAELIEAATELFLERGYEPTMVSDIVKHVGVAQGTFYYYFKTKEAVLDASLEHILREGADRVARLAEDGTQPALQRVEGFFRTLFSPRGSIEVSPRYARLLQDPAVQGRLEIVRMNLLRPVLHALIEEGAEEGAFAALRFPGEIAEIALRGAEGFMHGRREIVVAPLGADATMDALAEFMEKLLGLPDGTLDFKDRVIRRHA